MIDLNKHAGAILRAAGCGFGYYHPDNRAAILTACAALADDARQDGLELAAKRLEREWPGPAASIVRAIDPASLRGEK